MKNLLSFVIAASFSVQLFASDSTINDRDALIRETVRPIDRTAAVVSVNDSDLKRWMSGLVLAPDGQWKAAGQVRGATAGPRPSEYEVVRAGLGSSSAADHLHMADWCRSNKQPERERAHVYAALSDDPSVVTKSRMLRCGYHNVGNQWVAPERLDKLVRDHHAIRESLRIWRRRVEKSVKQLSRPGRDVARVNLMAIRDPGAVAAIDLILGRSSDAGARLAVRVLAQINCYESSLVMARYACFHDAESVRKAAIEALATRGRAEEFMPAAISLIATPAEVFPVHVERAVWPMFVDPRQHLLGRELISGLVIKRETENQIQVLNMLTVVDARIARVARRMSVTPFRLTDIEYGKEKDSVMLSIGLNKMQQIQNVERVNEQTAKLNGRIGTLLAKVTNREFTTDAKEMWQSWYANVGLEEHKTDDKVVVEVSEIQREELDASIVRYKKHYIPGSCFVAGTPVMTDRGQVPIEKICIGDRVLAKDVERGELAFRTVMKTTIRKEHALTRVAVGADEILCTPGHRFWHSGVGWVQARGLKAGDLLHTVTGSVAVTAVEDEAADKTYNLIVDGFHSYFVGSEGLLAQDLLLPTPTNMVVPGLTRFEYNKALAKRDAGE